MPSEGNWILWLLCLHGKAREYCNDLSYDGCHNMKLLTIQKAPFVSVLTEKLVVSELVRKFTLLHGTRNWLLCYLVTVLPCYRVTLLPCYLVTVLPLYRVTLLLLPCYRVTVLPCYRVALLPCYRVTFLPCYLVTVLPCYRVTLLPCCLVTVLPCYRVTKSLQTVLALNQINLFGII
jgi:hypothetical protein